MSDPYSAKELLNLESAFILKVYNHSGSTMDFKISNDQCMYLSGNTSITVPAFSWGEFEAPLQISYNVLNACAVSQSRFNITAFSHKGTSPLSNATYRVQTSNRIRFFGSIADPKMNMSVRSKQLFSQKSIESLVFERTAGYGDLFFNGRGMYVDNDIKEGMTGESIGSFDSTEVDEMKPTALINSNEQFRHSVDDGALATIAARWIGLGLQVFDVYSFAKKVDGGAKKAATDFKQGWELFKDTICGYYDLYKSSVSSSEEVTVHVHDSRSTADFHLLYAESTDKAADIMIGNFYLPPPPGNNNTFYQNILHLSQLAANAAG